MKDMNDMLLELKLLRDTYRTSVNDAQKNIQEAVRENRLYEAQEYLSDLKTASDKLSVVERLLDFIYQ